MPGAVGHNAAIADPLDKRLLFVTGKGGVGKTTVAFALGIAAAKRGKRVIVCEVAASEQASRLFRKAEVGFHETELRRGLHAISIDPDRSMREYLELQLPMKAMGDLLYRSRIFSYLAAATPGLREMVTIGKVWELALKKRKTRGAAPYDLVIVDAPATGHGVGFLQTPRTFAEIARVGPMARQASTIGRTITDERRCGAIIVALPEEMPVNESAALERELREDVGVAVDRAYMNALYPERFDDRELARIKEALERAEPGGTEAGALRAAVDESRRAAAQRRQLGRLRELLVTEVAELPFIFSPVLGPPEVERLAEEIA